ncbi:uncharacterized protein LOC131881468 isoform X2 [Tigriopus californicus]|uniref:uncharacterized protein LOC131881468 isoform X2 n=2 Tax=Tigriopus californicus TaxID=6832 RepID=UPI0027DAACBD|nr:uncharacterized protein LOC131881468 isoform X2 [Tigriopus californicus]
MIFRFSLRFPNVISTKPITNMSECDKMVSQLFKDFWSWRLLRTPEFASLAGQSQFNGKFEDYSLKRFDEDLQTCQDFMARLDQLQSQSQEDLSDHKKLNLRFLKAELETFITGYQFKGFYFPICYLEGVHIDFERLSGWMTLQSEQDYLDLIQRYESFPQQANGILEVLKRAVSEHMVFHAISIKGVVETFKKHTEPKPKDTVFWEPFQAISALSEPKVSEIRAKAEKAILECMQPAMLRLQNFIQNEYKTREEIAATSLPNGMEFYRQCIKFHTSTDLTAQEIHDIGLKEVDRIETEMKKIAVDLSKSSNVSLKDFMNNLRDDPSMYYNSKEEVLEGFKDIVVNRINPRLTSIFKKKPELDVEIVPAPQAESPAAFYISGTPDGARPGKFFVNVLKFKSQPKYDMMTLALHESNPGHHLQGSYLLTSDGIPEFRTIMEDRSYFMAPSRFPINTAYGEGWGLYSESLGFDLNLYDDPLDRFGHYSAEIFRACRLVVDTGLHAFGWTRQQAIDFMMEHSASSVGHTEAEIDRYITWPGQALGYKIGEIKIKQLRKKAEQALGAKFDLKEFHEVTLKSAGPLEVLEEQVDKFIANA